MFLAAPQCLYDTLLDSTFTWLIRSLRRDNEIEEPSMEELPTASVSSTVSCHEQGF